MGLKYGFQPSVVALLLYLIANIVFSASFETSVCSVDFTFSQLFISAFNTIWAVFCSLNRSDEFLKLASVRKIEIQSFESSLLLTKQRDVDLKNQLLVLMRCLSGLSFMVDIYDW